MSLLETDRTVRGEKILLPGSKDYRDFPVPYGPCKAAVVHPDPTRTVSFTKPTDTTEHAVHGLEGTKALKTIEVGKHIWTRLFAYISLASKLENQTLQPPPVHFTDCPNLPDKSDKYQSSYENYVWCEGAHLNPYTTPLVNDYSVQLFVEEQIHRNLAPLLTMRYGNTAATITENTAYQSTSGAKITADVAATLVNSPCWIPASKRHNIKKNKAASGFPDRVLVRSFETLDVKNATKTQVAVMDCKSPWIYPTTSFQRIYAGSEIIFSPNSTFKLNKNYAINCLLSMLWAQLTYSGTNIAWITNLDIALVAIREDTRLIISPLMSWEDPRLRACITALSFIALDEKEWQSKGSNLVNLLCPEVERKMIRFAADMEPVNEAGELEVEDRVREAERDIDVNA